MSRRRSGKGRNIALQVASGCLAFICIVFLTLSAWLFSSHLARADREVMTVEQLAEGRGRWVTVDDADLYVQEWGLPGRPTILLTHGTGAWSGTWFALPQALVDAGWRVVAVDLPPFGLSKTRASDRRVDYSRPAQARRLLGLIAGLGTPVTLVGHSFGAGPALEAALLAGTHIRQLILVDPALGLGPAGEPTTCKPKPESGVLDMRNIRTSVVGASATWPGFTGTLLKRFVYHKEVVTEQLTPAYQIPFGRIGFSASLGDWAISFAKAACEPAHSLDPAKLAAWAALGPPVVLIWGEQDTITPLAQGRALQAQMSNASLSVLPDVGHIPHIESPAAFADLLIRVSTSGDLVH